MGGLFGIVSRENRVSELSPVDTLFFGTDYHSHLGTQRGGLATFDEANGEYIRFIHDITNDPFRSKFANDLRKLKGRSGIGAISDNEDQPLVLESGLGPFAIASVNRVENLDNLVALALSQGKHFAETGTGLRNPTDVAASLISKGKSFAEGIEIAQQEIKGSCSMILLNNEGIYAARDKLGRTPLVIGERDDMYAVASESCSFPNIGFNVLKELGPGEIALITPKGIEQKKAANKEMQICSFLWVYYGYPPSSYEGINVEVMRYRCGEALADLDKADRDSGKLKIDFVAGIPDSGVGHAIGYANRSGIYYARPFAKYTPGGWSRSFMPQNQTIRAFVAKMKLIRIIELIKDKSILFCEDSIVRATQLKDTIRALYAMGAREIHMRPACPPLVFGCNYLNFSRSRSEMDLAGVRAIHAIENLQRGQQIPPSVMNEYLNPDSEKYNLMVEHIRKELKLTTLKYQRLDTLVKAIGLPKGKLCTHCWDGSSYF